MCHRFPFFGTESSEIIMSAAEFLSAQSANARVVLASCKDALLQALGTLMCHADGIRALETCTAASQRTLINALMRPYQGRAWGQSNWLLLRFWLGDGFAYRDSRSPSIWQDGNSMAASLGLFRSRGKNGSHTGLLHHIAPPCPSKHFQQIIHCMLIDDEPFSTTLINSILSQLNWAFSEFVLLVQEIQNETQRHDHHVPHETRQKKICSMCFDLTVSLMRALEMLISLAPTIFIDSMRPNSDTLLNRVCQLISQVLSRVTVPFGCFQHVVDLCLPDLGTVTHFAIISAVIGILMALLKDELTAEADMVNVPKIMKILLTDPSFQVASLEFVVGEVKTPIPIQQEIPRGNFNAQSRGHIDPLTNEVRFNATTRQRIHQPIIKFSLHDYPSHVSADEIERMHQLIKALLMRKSLLSDVTVPPDDSICTICYSKSISAVFHPCNHQSCSSCIIQHLMNNKVCFYCKTFIVKVENFDGSIIYEHTPTVPADEQL